MATVTLTLRGDQIASFVRLSGEGNGAERVVTLDGVSPLGTPDVVYTLVLTQVSDGATQFENGQYLTTYDPQGAVVAQLFVQPDIEQGLGAGDEHLILANAGLVIDLAGFPAGTSRVQYSAVDEIASTGIGDNDGQLDFADVRTDFPCFAAGTPILTPGGSRAVEDLRPGDAVSLADGGAAPIVWAGRYDLTFAGPDDPRRPVRLPAGALGPGLPERPLVLSPQHRILAELSGAGQVLVPARSLVGWGGIRRQRGVASVTWHALLLPRHGLLTAAGCPCESFYPGDWIVSALDRGTRASLLAAMPALVLGPAAYGPPARPVMRAGQATRLRDRLSFPDPDKILARSVAAV